MIITGYSLHSSSGAIVAHADHFEDALAAQRAIPTSVVIRRVSDGAVVAIKRGKSWAGIADEAKALSS